MEQLAQTTRISQRFLEALEADDLATLPSGPFARGFIRSYCEALSESAEEPLALLPTRPPRASASVPRRDASKPLRARRSLAPVLVSLALVVVLGAALAAVTMVLRPGRSDGPRAGGPEPVRTAEPTVSVTGPVADPPRAAPPDARGLASGTLSIPGAPSAPAPRSPSTTGMAIPYRLVARASDPTWIRVRMDGGRTAEETIPAGETREWISNRPFELRIGNAGGVSLELNGQPLPPLGARGAVIMNLVIPAEPR